MNAPIRPQDLKQQKIEPDDDESRSEFMDRCVNDAGLDEDTCATIWDERQVQAARARRAGKVHHKTHAGKTDGLEFVLSDETPDRMGDVISAAGWDLENFKKNPIALFGHQSSFPIGTWKNLRIEDGGLRGTLAPAPKGTSDRIDEIVALIDAGVLKAVSVGFIPTASEPRMVDGRYMGEVYTKQELLETSVVSVPANPNALAVAKSLKISGATLDLVFAEHGRRGEITTVRRTLPTGEQAETSRRSSGKGSAMSLAQRITTLQQNIVANRDALQKHLEGMDDSNVSDTDMATSKDYNAKIAQQTKQLAMLEESERQLAGTTSAAVDTSAGGTLDASSRGQIALRDGATRIDTTRTQFFAAPGSKKLLPLDYLVRSGVVMLRAKALQRTPDQELARIPQYNDENTKQVLEWALRAATAPATTTQAGWAAELVTQIQAAFMDLLYPRAVLPRLAAQGMSLSFGQAGRISIPSRAATPTIAGSFVGEGMPIPVRQGQFVAQLLTPKKLGVITSWTKEANDHSIPALEGLLRDAIQEDTAHAIDSVLLDANPATAIRPAGIFNGVAALTPTSLGSNPLNAMVGDLKNLVGAVSGATKGNLRNPVWLMNPKEVIGGMLAMSPSMGIFPFQEQLLGGNLLKYPVIDSGTVPPGTVAFVDAADFVMAGAEAPRLEISDVATIHEEDTNPLPISTPGTPATVAAPVRSLWQTDCLALRLIQNMNWTIRRPGVVAWVQGVTWS